MFWTTDNGRTWSNISPPLAVGDHYADVFFLNSRAGWVLVAHQEQGGQDSVPAADTDWTFYVAYTNNAGESWSAYLIPVMQSRSGDDLTDSGYIAFADDLHGWIEVHRSSTWGGLLRTADGGTTWAWVKAAPGLAGEIVAPGPNDLYIAGLDLRHGSELFATHDGGSSFQLVPLKPLAGIVPQMPTYGLPEFHGLLGYEPVTYSGGPGVKSAAVLFTSDDNGRSWKADRVLSDLDHSWIGHRVQSVIVGSAWMTAFSPDQHQPAIVTLSSGGRKAAPSNQVGDFSRCSLSFVSAEAGWANCSGHLLSTFDAGSTWADIGPRIRDGMPTTDPQTPVAARPITTHVRPSVGLAVRSASVNVPGAALASGIAEQLGFDIQFVPNAGNVMQQ
ncbi:MAG: hypothetical protein WBW84_15120 [Acidobacteriaceae bacterium]